MLTAKLMSLSLVIDLVDHPTFPSVRACPNAVTSSVLMMYPEAALGARWYHVM